MVNIKDKFDAENIKKEASSDVSPAYSFSALALVKCSNEGGTGPRHNMKEDPGTSTLIMKREHGQEVPCDPGQVTRMGWDGPWDGQEEDEETIVSFSAAF